MNPPIDHTQAQALYNKAFPNIPYENEFDFGASVDLNECVAAKLGEFTLDDGSKSYRLFMLLLAHYGMMVDSFEETGGAFSSISVGEESYTFRPLGKGLDELKTTRYGRLAYQMLIGKRRSAMFIC